MFAFLSPGSLNPKADAKVLPFSDVTKYIQEIFFTFFLMLEFHHVNKLTNIKQRDFKRKKRLVFDMKDNQKPVKIFIE